MSTKNKIFLCMIVNLILGISSINNVFADDNTCPAPPINPQAIPLPWQVIKYAQNPDWNANFSRVQVKMGMNIVLCSYGNVFQNGFVLTRSGSLSAIPPAPWYPCGGGVDAYCCEASITGCRFIPIH